jgi:hypothetical protein
MTLEQLIALGLTEDVAKKVLEAYQASLKDKFVPIERFTEINGQVKELKTQIDERDTQLKDLKTKATGNEALTAKIQELENLNKTAKAEYEVKMTELKKNTAIDMFLTNNNAKNIKAVKALLDSSKVSLDGENLIGLEEQVKALQTSDAYLFGEDVITGRNHKPGAGTPPDMKKNPWSKEHFNLTEQGKLVTENPELAAQLKAAAK